MTKVQQQKQSIFYSTGSLSSIRPQYYIVFFITFLVGAYFRYSGTNSSFWVDEVRIANIISNHEGFHKYLEYPANHRPLLYMLVCDMLSSIYNSEFSLRLTSLVPGILALVVAFFLSIILFRNILISLLFVFFLAVNPYLINLSKEFKPYILEFFLCLYLTYLPIFWLKKREIRAVYLYCLSIAPSVLLGYPCIFVIPCTSLVLCFDLYKQNYKKMLWVVALSTTFAFILFSLQYIFVSSRCPTVQFADWEKFFYKGGFTSEMFVWGGRHFKEMLFELTPGHIFLTFFSKQAFSIKIILALGVLLSLVRLTLKKEWQLGAIIWGPVLLTFVVSLTGKWPFGVIRTSGYLIVFLVAIVLLGWDYFFEKIDNRLSCLVFFFMLVIFQFPSQMDYYNHRQGNYWTPDEDFTSAADLLMLEFDNFANVNNSKSKSIISNNLSRYAYQYYTIFHSSLSKKYGQFFNGKEICFLLPPENEQFKKQIKDQIGKKLTEEGAVWILFYHYSTGEIENLRSVIENNIYVIHEKHLAGASIFLVILKDEKKT